MAGRKDVDLADRVESHLEILDPVPVEAEIYQVVIEFGLVEYRDRSIAVPTAIALSIAVAAPAATVESLELSEVLVRDRAADLRGGAGCG